MKQQDVAIRRADAAEAARLLHDFNTEEIDTAARALYESCGFTNRDGGPDDALLRARDLSAP